MDKPETSEITRILQDWNGGDEQAVERLVPFVYDELKNHARFLMAGERADHTLQPTALVHEAFIRISAQAGIEWENRGHFYAIVSRLMRQILVDYARKRQTLKRGENPARVSLDDIDLPFEDRVHSILVVDEIMEKLVALDERQAQIIEMRFFGGLSNVEIAEALDVSKRTVGREWKAAKLWLLRELSNF